VIFTSGAPTLLPHTPSDTNNSITIDLVVNNNNEWKLGPRVVRVKPWMNAQIERLMSNMDQETDVQYGCTPSPAGQRETGRCFGVPAATQRQVATRLQRQNYYCRSLSFVCSTEISLFCDCAFLSLLPPTNEIWVRRSRDQVLPPNPQNQLWRISEYVAYVCPLYEYAIYTSCRRPRSADS
jgi:hypothetical protein